MASADFVHEHVGSPSPSGRPIDSVAIKMAAGYNVMTPQDWQGLPADERFALVKAHRAVFLSDGISVATRDALAWLGANKGDEGRRP